MSQHPLLDAGVFLVPETKAIVDPVTINVPTTIAPHGIVVVPVATIAIAALSTAPTFAYFRCLFCHRVGKDIDTYSAFEYIYIRRVIKYFGRHA